VKLLHDITTPGGRNGGMLEVAQQMANHESARTTGLYDRRNDQVSLDEIERIRIKDKKFLWFYLKYESQNNGFHICPVRGVSPLMYIP
jgi:hypothetical protein